MVINDNLQIDSLRRFKDDATEVREGFECGIGLGSWNNIEVEDTIETYDVREKPRAYVTGVACDPAWSSCVGQRRHGCPAAASSRVRAAADGDRWTSSPDARATSASWSATCCSATSARSSTSGRSIRPVLARLRRLDVAVTEAGDPDRHRRALIAVATVSG